MFNLAHIHEAIAARVPERECLVFRDRRFRWRETTDRTRRLADVLTAHGLGTYGDRSDLANWESGQDHVALYLYNGNEYLEGMLGAFKARCAPLNVNYRYVEEELLYLFGNSRAKAIVYHAEFAPLLEGLRASLPEVRLWLQVADESGNALLPGALDYEAALAAATPRLPVELEADDLYILYTGGTTGMPKGVLWRQEDIFRAALYGRDLPKTVEELAQRAVDREPPFRCLPMPPFMHGAAHWAAFNLWHFGAAVIVQSKPRALDPKDIWSTIERERVTATTIVGDAFARPLLDELEAGSYDLSSLRLLTSGGAIFSPELKREFLERLPQLRILDNLGSSESGFQAQQSVSAQTGVGTGRFALSEDNVVLAEDLSGVLDPGHAGTGWLAKSGIAPLGYLDDPEKTGRTFPVVGGIRYSVPGDRARHEADGSLSLLGRDSVTINSGGEKIFAEEVEQAIKHHPGVYDALVVGVPSPRWGQQVTAIIRLREGQVEDDAGLREVANEHVASYKLPKAFVYVPSIERAPSGKPDYAWGRAVAEAALFPDADGAAAVSSPPGAS
jgi:fatty-acyl-CoA synthase